jgi:hypothetical protein
LEIEKLKIEDYKLKIGDWRVIKLEGLTFLVYSF